MDLSQIKLSKTEWENIEIPVSATEEKILALICKGFAEPDKRTNANQSLISFIKMENNEDNEIYLFKLYFEKTVLELSQKYPELNYDVSQRKTKKAKEPKKVNKMRIDNMEKNIEYNKQCIFEFLLMDFAKNILENLPSSEHGFYLYSLIQFEKSSIQNINAWVKHFIDAVVEYANNQTTIQDIIHSAEHFIEKNKYLIQYEDLTLFSHQRELFALFNGGCANTTENGEASDTNGEHDTNVSKTQPKLVLYIAPTGTGKTLSPLGLSQGYKIIFVCVARHIGLSLGKSAVSAGKHIAFAFGCETASDIRLHNFSASSFVKHRKSGGIFKIDNSVGDKVEIIICDVKSYLVAMHYMLSFNREEEIITYWDEPTITMDYEEHELHETIHRNWTQNKISKVVLSCATLPRQEEISATIADFEEKFKDVGTLPPKVVSITSYDCKKTISIVNKDGKCALPHLIFSQYRDVLKCVEHCFANKTLLRYFDLGEIVRFIEYVMKNGGIDDERYELDKWFASIADITMNSLKIYYLELLRNLDSSQWHSIHIHLTATQEGKFIGMVSAAATNAVMSRKKYDGEPLRRIQSEQFPPSASAPAMKKTKSVDEFCKKPPQSLATQSFVSSQGVLLTTQDAHTLTDGPTIYIVEDVLKVGKFYIQQSKIPERVFQDMMDKIFQNNIVQKKITLLEKNIEDELGKEAEKEKKMEKENFTGEVRRMKAELAVLQSQIQSIQMNEIYIPNCKDHQRKWVSPDHTVENAFVPNIEEENVRRIMMLEIDNQMKILLLLGIGVFMNQPNVAYMEIMKSLAYEQRLYLIIASSDYIYGTNYQFCHGFLGKDLNNMTQQKTIQAMGRIGRGNIQQNYTVRFRDEEMLTNLFKPMPSNLEAINMSHLFSS